MQTMNYEEAAKYLKVTEGTLRNWVSIGRIKPRRVGRRVIFFREELETWITTSQSAAPLPSEQKSSQPKQATLPPTPQVSRESASSLIPKKTSSIPDTTTWNPKFTVSFSDQAKDPYALLLDLPAKNIKMTPDDMRELARYLVDTASLCDQGKCRGRENFPIFRENERFRSSVVLVPFEQMRDLQTLALAAIRAGDVLAETKEKYVVKFIQNGLKSQLQLINQQLTKKGQRRINFKSLKK